MTEPLLRIRSLEKRFGGRQVLSQINLTLERGCCVMLLGESGSGKSTLAKIIAGLESRDAGDVHIAGQLMPQQWRARDFRRWAGLRQMVFQDPYSALPPRQTVLMAVCEALVLTQGRTTPWQRILERAKQCLDEFGIDSKLYHRYPGQLSGGQRQRAVIARAVIVNPQLLVLDEPTAALDVSVQAQIINMLNEIKTNRQMGLLFITHDILLAPYIADQVAVLYQGSIIEYGNCQQIMANPQHAYTRELLAALK